ncbi:MAG: FRG domain-containing protein [Butyrivibrio sp.]|nr:FRG domain-containing protein [Eubacterium sp.]MCM1191641.1 FRG domain-containing protein [Acetatifactor muris]MCM1558279.1 FRG domain-containing protein [Butyrivibrio sp.]
MTEYYVYSLGEFYDAVNKIALAEKGIEERKELFPAFWYRGFAHNHYTLLPSLYRQKTFKYADSIVYNQVKQMEDSRYQHYKSRAFHIVNSNPDLESEWMEIYQHYLGKTRMLDWTESARTALSFALEAYLNTKEDLHIERERETLTPVVAVINPHRLNEKAYQFIADSEGLIEKAVSDLFPAVSERTLLVKKMMENMADNKDIFFSENSEDQEMQGIVSLCVLERMRDMAGVGLKERIWNFEFNPFYYLVLRYYTDALPISVKSEKEKILPPLAILHPYHSDRIRKQRGVFTVFPNYELDEPLVELLKKRKVDVREMERQSCINSLISKIRILNPRRVAKELLYSGERRTELYPDLDVYAEVMETSKFPV